MLSVGLRSGRVLLLVLVLVSAGPPWVYHVNVEPYLSAMPKPWIELPFDVVLNRFFEWGALAFPILFAGMLACSFVRPLRSAGWWLVGWCVVGYVVFLVGYACHGLTTVGLLLTNNAPHGQQRPYQPGVCLFCTDPMRSRH